MYYIKYGKKGYHYKSFLTKKLAQEEQKIVGGKITTIKPIPKKLKANKYKF